MITNLLPSFITSLITLNKKNTLIVSIVLITATGIFAHFPALISDSIMWDDWIVLTWITQSRLDWVFKFYNNYGVTPYFLVDFPLVVFMRNITSSILIAKITYLLGVIINAIFIMLISKKVARGDLIFATVAGVLAVCFPALSGEGFHLSMLIYYFFIPLFFVGIIIFINIASFPRFSIVLRITALTVLLLSFSLNSLITMFYALIPVVFYASLKEEKQNLYNLFITGKTFLLRHIDFFIIPLVFWILKEIYMPRLGIYARYNKIHFDWFGILQGFKRLIPDILQIVLFVPLSIKFVFWIAALIFIVVVVITQKIPIHFFEKNIKVTSQSNLIVLLIFGFLILCGAALPYYMVGRRSFQAFGFMSRDNVLFAMPVSWIISALFCLMQKHQLPNLKFFMQQRIILGVFIAFIFSQSISNWRNHADWQAHYAYYRSAMEKISKDKLVALASIIQVVDELPGDRTLKGWKYPTSIWTEIVSATFQKTSRLAIPFLPKNGYFTVEEISKYILDTEINFMLQDINLKGKQIRLTVQSSNNLRSPIRLALEYWKARFFIPNNMPKLLGSLTLIKSEFIK